MKSATCSKLSGIQRSIKYAERKMVEVLDRRKKNGKDNEDSFNNHMKVNADGDRVWSF